MESLFPKKWYDNTGLVIGLCILFFPVGLYALWKSSVISKGWKIGGTAIVALVFLQEVNSCIHASAVKTAPANIKITPMKNKAQV